MNTTEAIRARRSIRKYKRGATIPQEHIDLMLEAAMCAPSAMNKRPYSFLVIGNEGIKAKLAEAHPYAKFLTDAAIGVVVCGDPSVYPKPPGQEFWPQDCAAATQTLMLQATELGYGTCWSAVYPNQERCALFTELLNIQNAVPFSLIAVGVPDEAPARRGFYDKQKVRYIR